MINLIENDISIDEYLKLRDTVGWRKLSEHQAKCAIESSLYFLKATDENGNILGMGRVIGDGAVICYIQDLVVAPDYQGMHIGTMIIEGLIKFAEGLKEEGTTMMLCLMCAKGREEFYYKHGFMARPNENLGPGMITYIK